MYDLVLEDATIVSSAGRLVADIAVQKGKIAYVGPRAPGRAREKMSAIGKFVMPGIIDSSVRIRSAGDGLEDWETASRAAMSGGVTTILDRPVGSKPVLGKRDLAARRRAAKDSRVNFGFWVGVGDDNLDKAMEALRAGAIAPFADLSIPEGPGHVTMEGLRRLFEAAPGIVGIQAEAAAEVAEATQRLAGEESPAHNDVRPPMAAEQAVRAIMELVRATGKRAHICSLSTATELTMLDPIKGDLPISTEISQHHLFLNAETQAKIGNKLKINPPLRDEKDRRALWTGLKRNRIDVVGSGHAGLTSKEKLGPYWDTLEGIPGVETTFMLLMSAVHHGRLGLERMVEILAENPARLFGLQGKGKIAKGYDADLVLFTEGDLKRFEKTAVLTRARWSPYMGRELASKPELVLVNGRIVSRRGEIVDDTGRGTEVKVG